MAAVAFSEDYKKQGFIELQQHILEKNKANQKYFVGRLSGNETRLTGLMVSNLRPEESLLQNMLFVAGIQFKSIQDIKDYIKLYNQAISKCSILGVWDAAMYNQAIQYYNFIDKMYPSIKRIASHALEPFYYMDDKNYNFPELFKDKKILIISSHKNTIDNQIQKNNQAKVFKKQIFHETSLFYVYKPSQQNAGNHDTNAWNHHFNTMKNELKSLKETLFDFDIALVSAGGFGMIVSEYIYSQLDSSVIYIGGPLQLYFGINGGRWKTNDTIKASQNQYWTQVIDKDRPKDPGLCENSSYW